MSVDLFLGLGRCSAARENLLHFQPLFPVVAGSDAFIAGQREQKLAGRGSKTCEVHQEKDGLSISSYS